MFKNYKKILSMIVALFLLIGVMIPPETADALFCGSMGSGLDERPIRKDSIVLPERGKRNYTIKELFQGSMGFIAINGEDDVADNENKGWFEKLLLSEPETGDRIRKGLGDNEEAVERVKSIYKPGNCLVSSWGPSIMSGLFSINNGIMSIAEGATTMLFNTEEGVTKVLAEFIGGKDATEAEDSIIGRLKDSLFLPLSVFAFILTGMWLFYTAIVKREFRFGAQGALWATGAFLAGLIVLSVPHQLVQAPQSINGAVSSCLLSAMNGGNCGDGSISTSTAPDWMEGCVSSSEETASTSEDTTLQINSLNCVLWKTFTLDAYNELQFRKNYDELKISSIPKVAGEEERYTVNLYSDTKPEDLSSNTKFSGGPIENFGIYILSLRTQGKFNPSYTNSTNNWINAIQTAALNPSIWNVWVEAKIGEIGYILANSIMQLFAMTPLVIISIYGLMYSLGSVLALALSPLFLLFAIHPGKGRKMFLGWLESIISNMLKYSASALLIVIGLQLYSAILGSMHGVTKLIAGIVLSLTLIFYRKEFIEIMGQVSMGGTKIKNVVAEKLEKPKQVAIGMGAGAIGGTLATKGNIKERLKGAAKGAAKGAGVEMKRGRGILARTVQVRDRVKGDIEKKEKEAAQESARDSRASAMMENARDIGEGVTDSVDSLNESVKNSSSSGRSSSGSARETTESSSGSSSENSSKNSSGSSSGSSSGAATKGTQRKTDKGTSESGSGKKVKKIKYVPKAKNAQRTDNGMFDYKAPILPDLEDERTPEEIKEDEKNQKSEIIEVNRNIIDKELEDTTNSTSQDNLKKKLIESKSSFKEEYGKILNSINMGEKPKMQKSQYNNINQRIQKINAQIDRYNKKESEIINKVSNIQVEKTKAISDEDIRIATQKQAEQAASEIKKKLMLEKEKEISLDSIELTD